MGSSENYDRMQGAGGGGAALTNRAGPGPRALAWLVEPIYAVVIAGRNRRYDALRGVERLGVPVVSVGNLTVGGTGKTPMVVHLARLLVERGRRPCIAMRGYARAGSGGLTGAECDEAALYASLLPGVSVVARPDRTRGVRELLALERGDGEGGGIDCVLLDDGFQHRRIARDLDIVLIDASRPPFEDRLLPAGWLREPVSSLRRAGAVVVTHIELVAPAALARLCERIGEAHGRAPLAVTRHGWSGLVAADAEDAERRMGVEWLKGKRIVAVCAIGNPEGFMGAARRAVELGAGGTIVGKVTLADHDPYGPATVQRVVSFARSTGAQAILTTEKDWAKLRAVDARRWPCAVVRPVLELGFDSGREELAAAVLGAVGRE